jgi:thioredoxin reductase (NADPH)
VQREEQHDVVVVGGGPAGISGALECFDIKLDTIVLESQSAVGGQLVEIRHPVRNVAAGRFEDGRALQRALERSSDILGDRVRREHALTDVNLDERWVEAGGVRFHAEAVLIASGSARQVLPWAGDGDFGGDVTYQLESDPDRFVGRDVIVVGGGDSATLDALELATSASSVKLVHRSDRLTARKDIVERVRADSRIEDLAGWEVDAVAGDNRVEQVTLVHRPTGERRRVAAGGIVVKVSRVPCTAPFHGQVELDHRGAVVVDEALCTSRAGVFAAGDVVSGAYWRVATAFGQGVLAARSILRHLEGVR